MQSVEKILLSVVSLLAGDFLFKMNLYDRHFILLFMNMIEPNDESPANVDGKYKNIK